MVTILMLGQTFKKFEKLGDQLLLIKKKIKQQKKTKLMRKVKKKHFCVHSASIDNNLSQVVVKQISSPGFIWFTRFRMK